MRVFITGASGFIGRALHERYTADGHDGVDETYPVHNTYVPYPDTKIASEQVVLQAHIEGRVGATIVRPGDVYGPRSRAWAVIPAQLIKARRFTLPGGGRGIHSPIYIDNLVDGVVLAAASPDAVGQIFTLSDGVGVPCREFFRPHAELVGRRLLTLPTPLAVGAAAVVQRIARLGPGDNDINPGSVRYLLRRGTYSNAKARSVLGWEPRVGVPEGLERTVAWLRAEGYGPGLMAGLTARTEGPD